MDFPGKAYIQNPIIDLVYKIEITSKPEAIWPWIVQMGYHQGGWYIDTWWDHFSQDHVWPRLVPKEARGSFKPPAEKILAEYQQLKKGDIVPDGPPGSAYYTVVGIEDNKLLLLLATTHFNYMAPQFVYTTRYAPRGKFCWAFIVEQINHNTSLLTSWWQSQAAPRTAFLLLKPFFVLADGAHQRQILQGIKTRVEGANE